MWLLFEVHTCLIDCYLIILNLKLYDRKLLFALKVASIASIMSFDYLPATCKIKLW